MAPAVAPAARQGVCNEALGPCPAPPRVAQSRAWPGVALQVVPGPRCRAPAEHLTVGLTPAPTLVESELSTPERGPRERKAIAPS